MPFQNENAVIHHGHSSPKDHSLRGPVLFCCAKSQALYVESFPDSAEAHASSWEITKADHIATWMEAGVNVLYFVFCDPIRPMGLLSGGLFGDEARQALYKSVLLESYAELPTKLR